MTIEQKCKTVLLKNEAETKDLRRDIFENPELSTLLLKDKWS